MLEGNESHFVPLGRAGTSKSGQQGIAADAVGADARHIHVLEARHQGGAGVMCPLQAHRQRAAVDGQLGCARGRHLHSIFRQS